MTILKIQTTILETRIPRPRSPQRKASQKTKAKKKRKTVEKGITKEGWKGFRRERRKQQNVRQRTIAVKTGRMISGTVKD